MTREKLFNLTPRFAKPTDIHPRMRPREIQVRLWRIQIVNARHLRNPGLEHLKLARDANFDHFIRLCIPFGLRGHYQYAEVLIRSEDSLENQLMYPGLHCPLARRSLNGQVYLAFTLPWIENIVRWKKCARLGNDYLFPGSPPKPSGGNVAD